ncbi:hypothetical protein IWW56_000086 [Coemansia sp. RSA 2131]|nr:hypothetical protein IWW56_000086 [Coemansia sp. RSA 2131]
MTVDARAAAQVCKIAADLAAHESSIQYTSLYTKQPQQLARGASFSSTIATLWQAPSFSLFGRGTSAATHVHAIDSFIEETGRAKNLVWLSWDDCRSLYTVFRNLEYVDAEGRPTPVVDSFVSRLADKEHAGDAKPDEGVQGSAWMLISRVFSCARALRVSAEAEEVTESDAVGVLTWFPRLEVLEVQGIPRQALRFWDEWVGGRLCALKMEYAGLDLKVLDVEWMRLVALDLSGNTGVELDALRGSLAQQMSRVARLSLARCELTKVPEMLSLLCGLETLDLSANFISDVADISLRLGNVTRLDLSGNRLQALDGLGRLWALEELNVADNELAEWTHVLCLRNLPSLRALRVGGNPFAQEKGSRAQIFSAFDHRDVGLVLDGRGPTSVERREMTRIPRVATEHRAGVSADARRRPKVAMIEESADLGDAGTKGDSGTRIDAGTDEGPLREKLPRVLRASELQAVRRRAGGRRATATTVAGVSFVPPRVRVKHTYSVPSSYTSRPCSPAPSMLANSVRAPSIRDPERYRRRVEMMRAEAGSSWLRAFAELQQQSEDGISEGLAVIGETSTISSPSSSLPALSSPLAPSSSPPELKRADTKLPSFLFPRRRTAAANRKREITRLPHYSPEDEPKKEFDEPEATLDEPAEEPEEPGQSNEPEDHVEPSEPEETEVQLLQRGVGVESQVEANVVRFWLADGHSVLSAACGQRTVYVTRDEIVETDAQQVMARVARAAVTRVRGDIVEVKASRHERAEWVQYTGGESAMAVLGVTDDATQLFRRAECLRCGWRGVVDAEVAVLDAVAEARSHVEAITACPACGRQYMREYFADDANESEDNARGAGIRELVGRGRRGQLQTPKAQRQHQKQQREAADKETEALRVELEASIGSLGGSERAAPFAEASNAVRLHLQLSVFEEGERLLEWVSAGLVRQAGAVAVGRARARSGAWGLAALLGSDAEADADTEAPRGPAEAGLAEQAVRVALSTHALYVFGIVDGDAADAELRPAEHLELRFSLALSGLGRIDVGPNRQYLALHVGLLGADNVGEASASYVLLVRDRLRCSDVLDALAELGYETRALDAGGAGSGRQRAINHDVEWAMHHLVQQVFLRASTFTERRNAAARAELQRSRSTAEEIEPIDVASGDDVIVDRVTYEFLKLYVCAGIVADNAVHARTVVATQHFVYVVRERVDVWPPPVSDLRVLYRRWQRAAPPMIVTSDPDTYDPETVAQRKNLPEANDCVPEHLTASVVHQYDRVDFVRPVQDLQRVTLVHIRAVVTGLAWRVALRLGWDTVGEGERVWTLWFATEAGARECADALVLLARASGSSVDLIE